MMNIGQAAEATGLTAKAIRHYESLGLVVPRRQENDYRDYSLQNIEDLRFLQRARAVGFSLDEAGQLLELYRDPKRQSATVKLLVTAKLQQLDQQWITLNQMRETLMSMANQCAGDESSHCAIINQLAETPEPAPMRFKLVD